MSTSNANPKGGLPLFTIRSYLPSHKDSHREGGEQDMASDSQDWDVETLEQEDPDFDHATTGGRGRTSEFQPLLDKWVHEDYLSEGKKLRVKGLTTNQRNNIRNLFYRFYENHPKHDKQVIIVRSSQYEDPDAPEDEERYAVTIRERQDGEYTRS